ncbi:MAG: DUF998 domain-containing protein [Clostridia bacterium]|nr:DUF998 domain-containing protein [Clostridia bacterium]
MRRTMIHWLGLTGVLALLSYTAAVVFSALAYPGYNWMAQAVSDLSAEAAPSRQLWNQLAAPYNICGVVCATCAALFVSQKRVGARLFRVGIYLFMAMNWVSAVGYGMFPLADGGKEIASFQEIMHMAVTALVVLLSIAALVCLIIAGCREKTMRGIGLWAAAALALMMVGSIGTGIVPPEYFGIVERSSVFAAVGFNAVLGVYLFHGFKKAGGIEHG